MLSEHGKATILAPNFGTFPPKTVVSAKTNIFKVRKPILFEAAPPKTLGQKSLSWPPWPWFRRN